MDILTYDNAKHRIGYSNYQKGYLLLWTSDVPGNYEHIVSWHVFTKNQAQDIIKLVVIMAYVESLHFSYTLYNTSISTWFERDRSQLILSFDNTSLLELYDQDLLDLIEDGFIDPKDYHLSALQYYNSLF